MTLYVAAIVDRQDRIHTTVGGLQSHAEAVEFAHDWRESRPDVLDDRYVVVMSEDELLDADWAGRRPVWVRMHEEKRYD